MKNKTIEIMGIACYAVVSKYANNPSNIRIDFRDAVTGEPISTATVWVNGLEEDEIAVKDWSENEGMIEILSKHGILGEFRGIKSTDWVEIKTYQYNKEVLNQYVLSIGDTEEEME